MHILLVVIEDKVSILKEFMSCLDASGRAG